MKTLYIDTTDNTKITVAITIDNEKHTVTKNLERQKSQIVLPLIEELLQEYQLTIHDLDTIEVNPGPGSFTGVRVGVSVANALSFALGIPVNGLHVSKEERIVEPIY